MVHCRCHPVEASIVTCNRCACIFLLLNSPLCRAGSVISELDECCPQHSQLLQLVKTAGGFSSPRMKRILSLLLVLAVPAEPLPSIVSMVSVSESVCLSIIRVSCLIIVYQSTLHLFCFQEGAYVYIIYPSPPRKKIPSFLIELNHSVQTVFLFHFRMFFFFSVFHLSPFPSRFFPSAANIGPMSEQIHDSVETRGS